MAYGTQILCALLVQIKHNYLTTANSTLRNQQNAWLHPESHLA